MKKQPIFFDENRPFAHYEAAKKLRKSAEKSMLFGRIFPIVILPAGIACAVFNPLAMALFTLFGVLSTILGCVGSSARRIGFTMASIPLTIAAAVTLCLAGGDFSVLGGILYFIAAAGQFRAMSAISDFYMLKELPGFPFFDLAMEDISFAAMEHHGADEYIEGELVEERSERAKLVPIEPPSEDMGEIVTEDIAAPVSLKKPSEENEGEPSVYERMTNVQTPEKSDVSDIDLLY